VRGLFFDGSQVTFRQDLPAPSPRPGEAIIRVRLAGLCQTDLEIAQGYMGFRGILGHEFVGTVTAAGSGADNRWIGKRVCGEINCVCGVCAMCRRGLQTHCLQRTVLGILNHDGAFAEFVRLPVKNLHAVPASVSDEQAVFVEPLAAAFQVLRQIEIPADARVMVLGDGRLGQLVARVLAHKLAEVTLVGRHPEKLELAANACGKKLCAVLAEEIKPGHDQDVVVECTGRVEGFEAALAHLRPRGTLVLKTTVAAGKPLNLAPIVIDEITVVGSRCGPFPDALQALADGEIDVLPLISRRATLESATDFFRPGAMNGLLKVIFEL